MRRQKRVQQGIQLSIRQYLGFEFFRTTHWQLLETWNYI